MLVMLWNLQKNHHTNKFKSRFLKFSFFHNVTMMSPRLLSRSFWNFNYFLYTCITTVWITDHCVRFPVLKELRLISVVGWEPSQIHGLRSAWFHFYILALYQECPHHQLPFQSQCVVSFLHSCWGFFLLSLSLLLTGWFRQQYCDFSLCSYECG